MQIEIYSLTANEKQLSVDLVAVCDSFSSLLWDVEFYQCGLFEVYIAANPENVEIFQLGRIIGRDDDSEHFGIIESVKIETDAETAITLLFRQISHLLAGAKNYLSVIFGE